MSDDPYEKRERQRRVSERLREHDREEDALSETLHLRARLAAAEALLKRIAADGYDPQWKIADDVRAFLAAGRGGGKP